MKQRREWEQKNIKGEKRVLRVSVDLLDSKELGEDAGALGMKMDLPYKGTARGWEHNTNAKKKKLCGNEIGVRLQIIVENFYSIFMFDTIIV